MAYYYKVQEEGKDHPTPEGIKVFNRKKSFTNPTIKFDFTKHVLIELLDDETPERELWDALGLGKNRKVLHKRMMIDSHRTNCRRALVVCTSSDEAKLLAKQLSQATIQNRCICAIVVHELLSDMCLFEKQIRQHGDTRPHHQLLYVSDLNRSLSPARLASFLKEKFCSLGTILSVFVSDKRDGFAAPEGVIKFAFLSEAYAAELAYDQSVLGMQRISVTVNQNILLAQCDLKARLREAVFRHPNDSFRVPDNEISVVGLQANEDNLSHSSFRTAFSSSSSVMDSAEKSSSLQQDVSRNLPEPLKNVNEGSSSKSFGPHSSVGSVQQYSIISSSADDQDYNMNPVSEEVPPLLSSVEIERLSSDCTWSSRVNEWISELPPAEHNLLDTPQHNNELVKQIYENDGEQYEISETNHSRSSHVENGLLDTSEHNNELFKLNFKNDKEQCEVTKANYASPPASVVSSFATCKEMIADSKSICSDIASTNLSFATCKDALEESLSDSNSGNTVLDDDAELDNTVIPLDDEDMDLTVPLCKRYSQKHSPKESPGKSKLRICEEANYVTKRMNGAWKQKSNFSFSDISPEHCIRYKKLPISDSLVISNSLDTTVPLKCGKQAKYLKSCEDNNTGDLMDMTVPLNGALQVESHPSSAVYNSQDLVFLSELLEHNNDHDSTLNSSEEKEDSLKKVGKFFETQNFYNPLIPACYLSDLKVVLKRDPKLDAIAKQFLASDPPVIKLNSILLSSENGVQDASIEYRKETRSLINQKTPILCKSNQAGNFSQAQCFKSSWVGNTRKSANFSKPSLPSYDHDSTLNSSISSKRSGSLLSQKLSLKRQKVLQEDKELANPPIPTSCLTDLWVVLNSDPELDAIAKKFPVSDPPVFKLNAGQRDGVFKSRKFPIFSCGTEQKRPPSEKSSQAGSVLRRSSRLASRIDKLISHDEKDESRLRTWLKTVLSLSTNNTLLSSQEGTKSIVCATMNKDVLISVGCSHMTCDICYPGSINLLLGYD